MWIYLLRPASNLSMTGFFPIPDDLPLGTRRSDFRDDDPPDEDSYNPAQDWRDEPQFDTE